MRLLCRLSPVVLLLAAGHSTTPGGAPAPAAADAAGAAAVVVDVAPPTPDNGLSLGVTYGPSMQPLVSVSVGNQSLRLVFDTSSGNTILFVKEKNACTPPSLKACYSALLAEKRHSLKVCRSNNENDPKVWRCRAGVPYKCDRFLKSLNSSDNHSDALLIDGLQYSQLVVEAIENMQVSLAGKESNLTFSRTGTPARLLMEPMVVSDPQGNIDRVSGASLRLFEGASGLLGGSGPILSCRNETFWSMLLRDQKVSRFVIDLQPPPNVSVTRSSPSRIVFHELDPSYAHSIVWSQPKQTGDVDAGYFEFLIYHPEVCGIDLLYNTSSNWLTVVDTSGPCLTFPPFLFDRFRARVPIDCPFDPGALSLGKLCSPRRGQDGDAILPSLNFQLEDVQETDPPTLQLPLEWLVFKNGSGTELLCVTRDDNIPEGESPNMVNSHIGFGSLALSAFYGVFNLGNHTVGLANKADLALESSNKSCTPSITCTSSMQTYFPPLNVCEDPRCADYIFMTLDESTRTCRWSSAVPISFGALLAALGVLDLISHRLYKQAIEKASQYCQ